MDPDSTRFLGVSNVEKNIGTIYIETIREVEVPDRKQEMHVVVHEIGHMGGYEDADAETDHTYGKEKGIMDPSAPTWYDKFTPVMIKNFRMDAEY